MGTTRTNSRFVEWLGRYLPAELVCLPTTLLCGAATLELSGSIALAALVSTWAEFVVYYALIGARDLAAGGCSLRATLLTLRNLVLEFGPAELLDSLLIRPAALAIGLAISPSPALGLFLGKLAADVVFYLPTILSYELLRRSQGTGPHDG